MNSPLFTDFYELTMAQGFWKNKMNQKSVFDVFFRRQPFNGGFSVFAGIEELINLLTSFKFSDDDINFLREQKIFEEDFLAYLKDFHFSGDLYSFEEGSIIFPNEVLVRIHANLIEAQIIEGLVLNCINFQSLIATKSARIWLASKKGHIMEFGLRRAQGKDGALSASRAAFIGGARGTSNTLAGKIYGIPVMGTMAHSWIMSFPTELEAFETYAEMYPSNCVFLIDTYDTLKSGIKNAINVGKKLKEKGLNFGVRLDSGDISYLSRQVRKELDNAGLNKAFISVSNELDEQIIESLILENAPVDSWGVGTNMVTGDSDSSFSGVYKLCARCNGTSDEMQAVMKFSDNPLKTTNPGVKNVWRLYDKDGMAKADILALEEEKLEGQKEYLFFHPMIDYRQFAFQPYSVKQMLKKKIENGIRLQKNITPCEQIKISRSRMEKEIETFEQSYKRLLNPHIYKVSVTEKLKDLKLNFIKKNLNEKI